MKFSATQLLAVLGLASNVAADFHILTGPCQIGVGSAGSLQDSSVACPSNYYNCNCMIDGDCTGYLSAGNTPISGFSPTESNYFQISAMCGVGAMNFYLQGDGSW
ncbi:hypothetical protein V8C35DRAFT_280999 [Trichoderma chlorosporum]